MNRGLPNLKSTPEALRFKVGSNFSSTIPSEDLDTFNELYQLFSQGKDLTNRDFLRQLAHYALETRKGADPGGELLDQILTARSENERLITEAQALQTGSASAAELGEENQLLQQQCSQLTAANAACLLEIGQLKEQLSRRLELDTERQFIVTLDRFSAHLMLVTCQGESQRLGKEVTPETLLMQMFLSYYYHGEHAHFPFYFSRRELRKLAESYKDPESTIA